MDKKLQNILTLVLFTMVVKFAVGQKIYTTNSGQELIINDNGKWELIEAKLEQPSNISFLHNKENTLLTSLDEEETLTIGEQRIISGLQDQLLYLEAEYFSNYVLLKQNSSASSSREIEILENKYKSATELIIKLKSIRHLDINERQNVLALVNRKLNQELRQRPVTMSKLLIEEEEEEDDDDDEELNNRQSIFKIDDRHSADIVKLSDCNIIFDGYDEQISKNRRETGPGQWFDYTHNKLMSHFKKSAFLRAESSLMLVNKEYLMNLRLTLATKDARRSYGYIENEAMLRISLINGESIYLNNRLRSDGSIEAYTGNTIYQCLYSINTDDILELKRTEIDKVGIMWSTGFEEYNVYEVDFLQNQISCLENGKK